MTSPSETVAFGDGRGREATSSNVDRFFIRGARVSWGSPWNVRNFGQYTHSIRPNFLWVDTHVSDMQPAEMDIISGEINYWARQK